LKHIKLQNTIKLQNFKSINKEIFIKTELNKYKNNEIHRIELIQNICYTLLPQLYIVFTCLYKKKKKKKNIRLKIKITCFM
jgi:hypothetical protein